VTTALKVTNYNSPVKISCPERVLPSQLTDHYYVWSTTLYIFARQSLIWTPLGLQPTYM